MPEAGYGFLPSGSRNFWLVAPCWGEGGQETRLRHTGQEESEAVHHLWGRLAILLQRGNAAILGNRIPNFPPPQIDGLHQ